MRLAGAVTQGSGPVNEDGLGHIGKPDNISCAWIFDGVTGINGRNYLPGTSDAAWLVGKAQGHLETLASEDMALEDIISKLVFALMADWRDVRPGLDLPGNYDPPAACLTLAKRYGQRWKAVRLGDSCLLARSAMTGPITLAASPNNNFDHWLNGEAAKRRDAGQLDVKKLLAEFQPQLAAARSLRNTSGGYSILEAHPVAIQFAEYIDLGLPEELLLCTDGYYRAVDYYSLFTDEGLVDASAETGGVNRVLCDLRAVEASDPDCQKYTRFKPADDATAVMLIGG